MKIKELEYLPVVRVRLEDCDVDTHAEAVSLYGHWCHMRMRAGNIVSVHAARVARIDWA
jgi:hypothetical protein